MIIVGSLERRTTSSKVGFKLGELGCKVRIHKSRGLIPYVATTPVIEVKIRARDSVLVLVNTVHTTHVHETHASIGAEFFLERLPNRVDFSHYSIPSSGLRRGHCQRLRWLLIHLTQFLPQLHQLTQLFETRQFRIGQFCGAELGRLESLWRAWFPRAFLEYQVKPRVPWHGDNDVLVEGQAGQLLVACDPNIICHAFSQQSTFRDGTIKPISTT